MKLIERYFWVLCVAVTLLGLFLPAAGAPLRGLITLFLAGILFFTGLKLDFSAALRELRRPVFLLYICAMVMVVLPLGMWQLARWTIPTFATGVLILAAMPAGVATSSLTDIAKGNPALALVVTLATSLACPVIVPLMTNLATGGPARSALGGGVYLARQAGYLAFILFAPLAAAYLVRRMWPALVARHREAFTGLSIVSLCLLILGAMSATSSDCLALLKDSPAESAGLIGFLFAFSAVLHLAGYLLAPWRPPGDKAALSITTAYVNNGLGIVFASQFFRPTFGAAAVLPAILLEIPMVLAILPVKSYLAWAARKDAAAREKEIAECKLQVENCRLKGTTPTSSREPEAASGGRPRARPPG